MNLILLVEQTYRSAISRIDGIPELLKALNLWYEAHPGQNFLHPCVIDGKAALVCQRNLSRTDGKAFAELRRISDRYRLYLKEDDRSQDQAAILHEHRRHIGLVLSFCLGLMVTSRSVTAVELQNAAAVGSVTAQLAMSVDAMQVKIEAGQAGEKIVSFRHARPPAAAEVLNAYEMKKKAMRVDEQAEARIKHFLLEAYQPEAGDPSYVGSDMAEIAHYFSQYPQVITLIEQLWGKKLVLKYKADNWQAQAWGNQLAVDSVTIFFDTRLGAQLWNHADCRANPACNISPADALLHEMLHAKLMLVDSHHFIEIGGMQQNLYPFEHEREVMAGENRLYQDMNGQDGLSRPLRHRHSGQLVHVDCVACLPTKVLAAN